MLIFYLFTYEFEIRKKKLFFKVHDNSAFNILIKYLCCVKSPSLIEKKNLNISLKYMTSEF